MQDKKRKPGRPRGATGTARRQYQIRLDEVEHAAMVAAAERVGERWSTWARQVLRRAAGLDSIGGAGDG